VRELIDSAYLQVNNTECPILDVTGKGREILQEVGSAFLIFHDKTLKAIAGHKPVTPAALLEIPGIGALKAERYGRRVLEVVNGDK